MVCTLKTTGSLFMEKSPDRFDGLYSSSSNTHWPETKMIWLHRKILNQLRNQLLRRFLKCTAESSWDLNSSWPYPSQSCRFLIRWLKQMEIICFSSTGCSRFFYTSTITKEIFSLWNYISSPHHAVSCCTSHWIELRGTSLSFLLQPSITLSLPLQLFVKKLHSPIYQWCSCA